MANTARFTVRPTDAIDVLCYAIETIVARVYSRLLRRSRDAFMPIVRAERAAAIRDARRLWHEGEGWQRHE